MSSLRLSGIGRATGQLGHSPSSSFQSQISECIQVNYFSGLSNPALLTLLCRGGGWRVGGGGCAMHCRIFSLIDLSITGCQYPRLPMVATIDVSRNQPADSGIKGPQCRVPSVPYRLNTVVGPQPSPALFLPNGFSWLWVTWRKRPFISAAVHSVWALVSPSGVSACPHLQPILDI